MPPLAALRAQWKARDGDPWDAVDRAALLRALARTRLRQTPGTGRIRYSNLGVGVLGHVLVAASNAADYGELVRSRICDPLGMTDTVLLPDRDQAQREASATAGAAGPPATGRSPACPALVRCAPRPPTCSPSCTPSCAPT